MAAKVIAISIPENMHLHVKRRAAEYASLSEYFRELIRHDQRMTRRFEPVELPQPEQTAPARWRPLASAARRHR